MDNDTLSIVITLWLSTIIIIASIFIAMLILIRR